MTTTPATSQQRRAALFQDTLLFCGAFSAGAILFTIMRAIVNAGSSGGYWEIGLSDGLILSGLIFGELFIVWNNGYRQGIRGHSIGKHRAGLRVVDVETAEPTGIVRGLARGLILAALLDLAVAAIPINLPTVLRRLTPDSWHFGGAAYIAVVVLLVPFAVRSNRDFADIVLRTKAIEASGADATTAPRRKHILEFLDILGVLGVIAVAANYVLFYWPLLFHFPNFF